MSEFYRNGNVDFFESITNVIIFWFRFVINYFFTPGGATSSFVWCYLSNVSFLGSSNNNAICDWINLSFASLRSHDHVFSREKYKDLDFSFWFKLLEVDSEALHHSCWEKNKIFCVIWRAFSNNVIIKNYYNSRSKCFSCLLQDTSYNKVKLKIGEFYYNLNYQKMLGTQNIS